MENTKTIKETKEVKLTKLMICRKDRFLTKGELKHIKSMILEEYFNEILRIEKLSENIYTIRFKKNATVEDYKTIKPLIERRGYKLYTRTKPYKQIKEEQKKVAIKNTTKYLKQNLNNLKKIYKNNEIINTMIKEANALYKEA